MENHTIPLLINLDHASPGAKHKSHLTCSLKSEHCRNIEVKSLDTDLHQNHVPFLFLPPAFSQVLSLWLGHLTSSCLDSRPVCFFIVLLVYEIPGPLLFLET